MEELNLDRYYDLRGKTLANNLTWLASFGCEIVRRPDLIQVRHPDIPEYNAHLVVGLMSRTAERLESLLENSDATVTIYVDEPFVNDLNSVLLRYHMRPKFSSRVKVSQLTTRKTTSHIKLRLAKPTEVDHWSTLYSIGFGRIEPRLRDRKRWQQSFNHPEVSHWFLTEQGHDMGVLQTCSVKDVTGIYSVTLSPSYRTMRRIIAAARSIQTELIHQQIRTIYFERIKKRVLTPRDTFFPMFRNFMTLRRFFVYQRSERIRNF
jgi:hypothetical protein